MPNFNHTRTGGLRGSKLSLYEGGIRVPFIVRWPGHTTAGRVDERTVLEMVDLFPTFCAIARAPMPAGALLRRRGHDGGAGQQSLPHTKTIFWEYGRKSKFFNYPGPVYDRSPHLAASAKGNGNCSSTADGSRVELYDLNADGNETENVAAANPELAKRLADAALNWKRSLPRKGLAAARR